MIAKLIAHAPDRDGALAALRDALGETRVAGAVTNAGFLRRLLADGDVRAGRVDTGLIERRGDALRADPEPDAAARLLAAMAAGGMLPPGPRAGFRLWGRARAFVALERGGARRDAVVVGPDAAGFHALDGEEAVALRVRGCEREAREGETETFRIEAVARAGGVDRALSAVAVLHPGARPGERALTLHADGATHRFGLPDPLAAGADAAAGGDAVLAPMPGTVTALDVAPGDAVERGQRLAVLEAMKMEHALRAPRAGTVASAGAVPGQAVAAGDAVVTLEPEGAPGAG